MYRYIFDIGSVLVKYDGDEVAERLAKMGGFDPETVKKLFSFDKLYPVETGRMPVAEFFAKDVQEALPGISFDSWLDKFVEHFEVNPEGFELMLELKAKGRKVYILSNLAEYHKVAIERKIPGFFEHTEHNFLSYQMGYHKPEQEIYQKVCEKVGDKPENCVFFDDVPKNIEGAQKAGLKGILFSNDRIVEIRKLVQELEK